LEDLHIPGMHMSSDFHSLGLHPNLEVCCPILADEELARMEEMCMDAARRRLREETCVRIEKIKAAIEMRDFVIIQSSAEVEEPFHVAEVVPNCSHPQTTWVPNSCNSFSNLIHYNACPIGSRK
jgi:hypothetical protein